LDWFDVTGKYHEQTFASECRLSSLPENWQRELAALWRLEVDVNSGAYLQFLANWGRESYLSASQALRKIGARKMAEIVDKCQAPVDEHFNSEGASREQLQELMPNAVIGSDGRLVKEVGAILPEPVLKRINELSSEFMDYPEDLEKLGVRYYRAFVESARSNHS
jgi:hypothetical protein